MRLAEYIGRYPSIRVAEPADNEIILAFYDQAPMQTSAFALQYQRAPDFFRLLRYQADRAYVFINVDDAGAVRGVAALSLRPGWMDGKPVTIGYLGDLRVGLDRRIAARWLRWYGEVLANAHEIEELSDCSVWFTAVLDDNAAARRALTRSARGGPTYVPLAPFTMRNVVARLPFQRRRDRGWHVSVACTNDVGALTEFFEAENRQLPLGFRGELSRRLQHWDGLRVTDFVLASDAGGIVACVAPWSPSLAKQTIVSRVPPVLRAIGRAASALPGRPLRVPMANEALRAAYLTHLTFASRLGPDVRAAVFRVLLDHVFDRWPETNWHCAAVADFRDWDLGRALGGYVQQRVPITVYSVVPPGRPVGDVDALRRAGPPAFEMAIV